ncbi:MAG: PD40 domain-containing protein [Alphaproteobacteria bacterium]|nr:PD40 domain-containing protein [Alphaproteobacteria bacterium]HPF46282.1 amidohydrolase family protein [Emcibacteraceae bacterium]
MRALYSFMVMSLALMGAVEAKEIKFSQGTNFGISVSSDGKLISMDLQGVLWTVPAEGGMAKPLTAGQQPEAREPSFSPDGKKIAFQGYYQGYFHIWTINSDGSGLKQITSGLYDDREPSWNADGDTIVFASDRDGSYDIWEINVKNGSEKKLTNYPDDEGHPNKSNNGERLLFTREIKGRYSEIAMIDYTDDKPYEISLMKTDRGIFIRPSWTNNSEGFSYISQFNDDIRLNYVTDAYSLEAQKNTVVIDQGDIFPFRSVWSEQGIFYTADGQIKFRPVKLENRRNKIRVSLGEMNMVPFEASITSVEPNYTHKVRDFDSRASQPVRGIGAMDVSSKNNNIVFTALGDMWVQEGDKLSRNIDDGPGHVVDPAWSRDGDDLAFVAERDGQMDIWIRNVASGKERRLTNDLNREYRLAWSRDGKYIAYLSTRGISNTWGRSDLKVIDVEYGNIHTIDEQLFTPGKPTWSVDGKHLVLAVVKPATSRFREGMHALKQYEVESGRSKFLNLPNNIGLSTRDGSGPVISYDGGKIAYIAEGELRVAYVNNAGEITGAAENKCLDTALMPRWARGSERIYYFSGKSLKSCNFLTGETQNHTINLSWKRASDEDITIHVGRIFDGVSDQVRENVDVFVSKGRITSIAPHGQYAVIGKFYDYSHNTMIPGLMAGHSHQTEIMGEKLGRNWLAYGITSVRDPGSNPYKSLERRETWDGGISAGPRLFNAGWLTGGARVYYGQSYNALNEKALRHELQRAEELDYDMIKSYVRLPDEYQQILIADGHKLGIPLSSHEIAPAVQNSMDSVEHISATSRRGYSPKFSSLAHSYEDVINIISESGLFITPTAVLDGGYYKFLQDMPEYKSDIKYRTFLDQLQRDDQEMVAKSGFAFNAIKHTPALLETIKKLHDHGANVAAGTDSPFIPYGIAQQLEIIMFEAAGLSPADAIRAGTIKVAQNIGVEADLGTLEVGKLADMVILNGNPIEDIRNIRNVEATIKGGHLYTIRELTTNRD